MTTPGRGAVDGAPQPAPPAPTPVEAPGGSAAWRAATLRARGFVALRGQRAAARDRWTAALAARGGVLGRAPDLAGALTDAGFAAGWRVVRGGGGHDPVQVRPQPPHPVAVAADGEVRAQPERLGGDGFG